MKVRGSFIFLFFLVSQTLIAQVEKGDTNLGLNLFVSSLTEQEDENINGTINMSYQKYVTRSISLGFGPVYSYRYSGGSKSQTLGLNLFANYSFLTKGGKTLPYLGAQYSTLMSVSSSDASSFDSETLSQAAGGNAGVKFFFNEYANLDLNLSYTSILSTTITSGGVSRDVDAVGGLLQFTVGIGVIIGKK